MGQASIDTDRTELHELLDSLPLDDESESEEERAEVEEARAEQGPGTPHEEVLREFGL